MLNVDFGRQSKVTVQNIMELIKYVRKNNLKVGILNIYINELNDN